MSALDQIWTDVVSFVHDNADLLGVVFGGAGVLVAIFFGFAHWPRKTQTKPVLDPLEPVTRLPLSEQNKGLAEAAAPLVRSSFAFPQANPDFIGRGNFVRQIKEALEQGGALITAIEGMGGIGKTSTSLQTVHELLSDGLFRDGVAFIDLEGFSASREPKTSREALGELLRPLVDAKTKLPNELTELQRLWREKTAGLDMLLFLDNARDEEQIKPCLPGHPAFKVLITSRNRFALSGLRPINLTEMAPEDSRTLALRLANRRHPDRLKPDQAARLAGLCGYLPLAIEVATNTLDQSSGLDVEFLLGKLAERNQPSPALEKAKASLHASLNVLENETRARWQELGVLEGGFDRRAAAAVWEIDEPEDILSDLELRSLIHYDREVDRYRLHDILRAIAIEELSQDLDRSLATGWRHAQHYCDVLAEANQLSLDGGDQLLTGLRLYDREEQNIAAGQAWAMGRIEESEEVTSLLAKYADAGHYLLLWFRGSQRAQIVLFEVLLGACRKFGDKQAEGNALGCLARVHAAIGHCPESLAYGLEWLAVAREIHEPRDEGEALNHVGYVYYLLGQPRRALEHFEQAIPILRNAGDRRLEGYAIGNMGDVFHGRGDNEQAIDFYERHLKIGRELGERLVESNRLGCLGSAYASLGEFQRAIQYQNDSLAIARKAGARKFEGWALRNLGLTYAALGEPQRAIKYHERALTIARETEDDLSQGRALGSLGCAYAAAGDLYRAIELYERHVAIAAEISHAEGQGNSLYHCADALCQLGQCERAIEMMREATSILERIESPLTEKARAKLVEWRGGER